jgi:HD-GYP domain-containing protein (c-di-GMP phosphodiesterase class II)
VSDTLNEAAGPGWPQAGAVSNVEGVLEVLERFGLALHQADQGRQQVLLTLDAIRDSLGADVVFWYPGISGEGGEHSGGLALPPEWPAAFVRHAVAEPTADRLVRHFLDPAAKPIVPWPCSAALVRISRTCGSWLGGLSFHPRRLFLPSDLNVMLLARRMLLSHRQQGQVHERLRESLFGLVRCLTAAIDAKDPYTWGHSERVARIAVRLSKQMGLPTTVQSDLYLGGLLHDIGKIGIRDDVLQKPGKLSAAEFEHIKLHVMIGDRLISNIKPLQHLRSAIRNHHERFDGKGYPDGLSGEGIPLQARLLAIADSCDAMMAARPYRPALPPARIDTIMLDGAGTQWDPDLIAQFMTCRHELYSICERGLGDSVFAAVERALHLGDEASSRLSAARG